MDRAQRRPASYDDILRAPSHLRAELIDGELSLSPRPAAPHALASAVVGMDIGTPFQRGRGGPGGWWILFEPELHLDTQVMVPDLAGWRRERLPHLRNEPFFPLVPDWVCEVISPSSAGVDRVRKQPLYLHAGVAHLWLIDPIQRTLESYQARDGAWVVSGSYSEEKDARVVPFEAVELDIGSWWLSSEETDNSAAPKVDERKRK
ncbi:MAG: Uma2 family endonuclease [Myxococcota bacterium]|jgi:Uma2 family endonuclease|nr:Uma2 family endonuclease [Myxococcota bacterium]